MGPNGIASYLLVLFRAACMPRHSPLLLSDGVLLQQISPSAVVSCPPGTAGVCGGLSESRGGLSSLRQGCDCCYRMAALAEPWGGSCLAQPRHVAASGTWWALPTRGCGEKEQNHPRSCTLAVDCTRVDEGMDKSRG